MKQLLLRLLSIFASKRNMNYAFADQIMVSGSNFLTGILLARAFGIVEFGIFTLGWMFVEFMGSLQAAAVIQPMLNIGPKQLPDERASYFNAVLAQQAVLCAAFGPAAWLIAILAGQLLSDTEFGNLAIPLAAAVVGYQLQCFFRRYFYARERAGAVLVNDALRFSVQIPTTAALVFWWPGATAAAGLWIVAASCGVSALHGAIYFGRPRWNPVVFAKVVARHWDFSKWLLPSAFMYWMTSQGFPLMSGFVLGAAATGGLRVALAIVGVLNILLLAVENFAPVQAARAVHNGGQLELYRNIVRLALLTFTLVVVTVTLINIDPEYLLRLLYGDTYSSVTELVRWLCASAAIHAVCSILVIWAAALERARIIYVSYAAATVFTAIAAYPLTLYGGLGGVVAGAVLVEAIRAAVLLAAFLNWRRAVMSSGQSLAVGRGPGMLVRTDVRWEVKEGVFRAVLRMLGEVGLPRLMARHTAGQGAVIAFHRIYAPQPHEFGSHALSIAPNTFRRHIQTLQDRGYDFVKISDVPGRLRGGRTADRKFICITFDDGFVDTYTEAFPICREFGVPMTVYLVSSFVQRAFPMWSFGLEAAVAGNNELEFTWGHGPVRLYARTKAEKRQAYSAIASFFASAQPQEIRCACAELGSRYGVDFSGLSNTNALTPEMITEMRDSGLVEFGAHTVHHARLSILSDSDARQEILQSKRDCEAIVGAAVRHFAYPYGDRASFGSREIGFCRELGINTAVTTDSNTMVAADCDRLLALPRLSYNGRFQDTPLLDLLISGALPRLRRGLRPAQACPAKTGGRRNSPRGGSTLHHDMSGSAPSADSGSIPERTVFDAR
jgi:O-antigen/teichoic acid export membrane protein/peptidoglycan/xylan/chitin deacetylase (PgdA/CDA1 family)